jgi:endonuclease/exonuclease/phosphatase family metal-dependent hydrolase
MVTFTGNERMTSCVTPAMKILSQNLAHGMLAFNSRDQQRRKIDESMLTLEGFLLAHPVDVVCAQELASDAPFDLPGFSYVHRVSARGMDVAIASRFPLSRQAGGPFLRSGVGKAVAWVTVDGKHGPLRVGSMHLAVLSPMARRRQLTHAIALADAQGVPLFLVGDTNEPRSRVFDAWSRPHGLEAHEPGASFPAYAPILRLDRALVTEGVRVIESAVKDTAMSDHRAVTFEVMA